MLANVTGYDMRYDPRNDAEMSWYLDTAGKHIWRMTSKVVKIKPPEVWGTPRMADFLLVLGASLTTQTDGVWSGQDEDRYGEGTCGCLWISVFGLKTTTGTHLIVLLSSRYCQQWRSSLALNLCVSKPSGGGRHQGGKIMPFDLEQTVHHFQPLENGGLQMVTVKDPPTARRLP